MSCKNRENDARATNSTNLKTLSYLKTPRCCRARLRDSTLACAIRLAVFLREASVPPDVATDMSSRA